MKNLLLLFLLCSSAIFAATETKSGPDYKITKTSIDKSLKPGEAVFVFKLNYPRYDFKGGDLTYNGKKIKIVTDSNSKYTLKLIPGKYIFNFSGTQFSGVKTDSITIGDQSKIEVDINFTQYKLVKKKPVIYFYPEKETKINAQLTIKGEFTFTYPEYKNGWNFTAEPNGNLLLDGKSYNYLFWEGESDFYFPNNKLQEGFLVASDSLLDFLETNLSAIGLNSKEKQDFITFWYPQMKKNDRNYIHFIFNEEYNLEANLVVTPKPDNSLRVFIYWSAIPKNLDLPLKKQTFPQFKRAGFSLVEWGGTELENLFLLTK